MLITWATIRDKVLFFMGVVFGNIYRKPKKEMIIRRFNGETQQWETMTNEEFEQRRAMRSPHNLQESRWKNELYYYMFERDGKRFFIGPYEPIRSANGVPHSPPLKIVDPLPADAEIVSLQYANLLFLDEALRTSKQPIDQKIPLETLIREKIHEHEWDFSTVAKDRRHAEERLIYWRVVRDPRDVVKHVEFFSAPYIPDGFFAYLEHWGYPFVATHQRASSLLAPLGFERVIDLNNPKSN